MDLSIRGSIDALEMWNREASELGVTNIPTMVLGNKVNRI
jgi:hypothetical protein